MGDFFYGLLFSSSPPFPLSQGEGASHKGDGGIIVSLATTPLLWRGWGRILRLLASDSLVFARVVSGGAIGFAGRGAGH